MFHRFLAFAPNGNKAKSTEVFCHQYEFVLILDVILVSLKRYQCMTKLWVNDFKILLTVSIKVFLHLTFFS